MYAQQTATASDKARARFLMGKKAAYKNLAYEIYDLMQSDKRDGIIDWDGAEWECGIDFDVKITIVGCPYDSDPREYKYVLNSVSLVCLTEKCALTAEDYKAIDFSGMTDVVDNRYRRS